MSFIFLPLAVVDVSICMDQSAFAVSFVIGPVSFVHAAIRPDLDALALTNLCLFQPFSLILSSILKEHRLTKFALS